jgi:hypothetical protein
MSYSEFDESGNYLRTTNDNKWHNFWFGKTGRIVDGKGNVTRSFNFADPDNDVKDLKNGTINKIVFVSSEQIGNILGKAGALNSNNRKNEWDYIKKESPDGNKLDFSYSSIPFEFPGASFDPLTTPSSMLFLPEGDNYAHNHMNFGNFLWGAAGSALGFSGTTLSLGAHYNSLFNSSTNGYKSQLDSSDDQLSISRGVNYSSKYQFNTRTWAPSTGLSPMKKR